MNITGEKVMLEISLDNFIERKAYYVAMRALDRSLNTSPISNVQTVFLDPQGSSDPKGKSWYTLRHSY